MKQSEPLSMAHRWLEPLLPQKLGQFVVIANAELKPVKECPRCCLSTITRRIAIMFSTPIFEDAVQLLQYLVRQRLFRPVSLTHKGFLIDLLLCGRSVAAEAPVEG